MTNLFYTKLVQKWSEQKFLCIGLDPDLTKIPQHLQSRLSRSNAEKITEKIVTFNKAIIDVTADIVCAFKPNSAFYEAYGVKGIEALKQTIAYIHEKYPDIPVALDAKRGDIGNTNKGYASYAFDYLKADAMTVQPYLGKDAVQPLLDRKDKGIIILVKTSNKRSGDFQDMLVGKEEKPLYKVVAESIVKDWNINGNCALVVGATYPEELKGVRAIVGDMPILIPGVGAQGGSVADAVRAGKNNKGTGIIIATSRAVLYASNGEDFAKVARKEAEKLHNEIKNNI